jgi:hypothetical protein
MLARRGTISPTFGLISSGVPVAVAWSPVLTRIAELVGTGAMTATVTSVPHFDHLHAAIGHLGSGALGKIAVTVSTRV